MDIYNYNAATGEFLGQSVADPDPKVEGRFLLPAHATYDPPSKTPSENEALVFENGAWSIVADFRGAEYWLEDGSHIKITALGETMPEGALSEAPPPPPIDPLDTPLTPVQFHRMLAQSGKKAAIYAAIEALPEIERDDVLARIEYTLQFERSDPLFNQLGAAVNLTPQDIDVLWASAVNL